MALQKEIEFVNQNYRRIKSQMESIQRYINSYTSSVEDNQRSLETYKTSTLAIRRHLGQFAVDNVVSGVLEYQLHQNNSSINDIENRIRSLNNNIRDHQRNLLQHEEQLGRISCANYTLTKADLKDILASVPSVDPKSVCVGVDASRGAFARWKHVGIVMKPDENTYANINFGEAVEIPLNPQVVTFFVERNEITVTPPRGGLRFYGMADHRVSHPHILSRNAPCLGDFTGPVTEAMDDKDYATVATLMDMYLSQAASDDGAGMYWFNFIDQSRALKFARTSGHIGSRDDAPYRYHITGTSNFDGDYPRYERDEAGNSKKIYWAFTLIDGEFNAERFDTYQEYLALKDKYLEQQNEAAA